MLKYELQFFAKEGEGGEKTEDATPKKLEDARKEGQVAKSQDIGVAAILLIFFAAFCIGHCSRHFIFCMKPSHSMPAILMEPDP